MFIVWGGGLSGSWTVELFLGSFYKCEHKKETLLKPIERDSLRQSEGHLLEHDQH